MDLSMLEELKDKLGSGAFRIPMAIGLAAVFIMVAVVAGRMFFMNAATAKEFPVQAGSAASSTAASTSARETSSSSSASGTIYAHVSGCVNAPGLVEVPSGSRVAAAIEAAGGFAEGAAAESVNLAREVSDGEQLRVLSVEEQARQATPAAEAQGTSAESSVAEQSRQSGQRGSGKVNINTASTSELQSLSGVGQATAQKIIDYRTSNGGFSTIEDLKNVSGIGDKKFDKIKDQITV